MIAAPDSQIAWHANKGTVAAPNVVNGGMGFQAAYFQDKVAGPFYLMLSFDLASLSSGAGLRDQRIRDIIFGAVHGQRVEYEAIISPADALAVQNLTLNESLPLTLSGNISLWGVSMPLSVPITVSRQADGIHIASGAGFSVGITQLGLSSNVTTLTSICGGVPLDTVPVDFNFKMTKPCG